MTFKSDKTKKKEFGKVFFRHTMKHYAPIFMVMIPFVLVVMTFVFLEQGLPTKSIVLSIGLTAVFSTVCIIFSFWLGVLNVRRTFDTWELTIEDTYAVLKNSMATTTVHFSDIKRYKETPTRVTYYLGILKRFYIDWNLYENSAELKARLDAISARIGTYVKPAKGGDAPKTGVKFSRRRNILLTVVVVIAIALRVLAFWTEHK